MNDAIAYTHEIEHLCDLLHELCENSNRVMEEISFGAAVNYDYGLKKILLRLEQDFSPYTGTLITSLNRDVLDDLLFMITGLIFLLGNSDDL